MCCLLLGQWQLSNRSLYGRPIIYNCLLPAASFKSSLIAQINCPFTIMPSSSDQSSRNSLVLPTFLILFYSLVSISSFPDDAQASASRLDRSCRSSIERSIASAGFSVQPSGFIINRIRSGNSVERALSSMWASSTPAEIGYADLRGSGRYYISITLPPPPGQQGQVSTSLRGRIRALQSALHRETNCIQTLRIGFERSGPYQCTWLDSRTGSIKQISHLDVPSDRSNPKPGLDYCQ